MTDGNHRVKCAIGFCPSHEAVAEIGKRLIKASAMGGNDWAAIESGANGSAALEYSKLVEHVATELPARAIQWLRSRFSPGDIIELRALSPLGHGARSICIDIHSATGHTEAAEFLKHRIGWQNLYFGLQPRDPRFAGSTHTCNAGNVHVHRHALIDLDQNAAGTIDLPAVRQGLKTTGPVDIVNTGGGVQAIFRLPNTHDRHEMEARQRALDEQSARIGADAVNDPPRIARLAWTINIPTATKREKGRDVALAEPCFQNPSAPEHDIHSLIDALKALEGLAPPRNSPKPKRSPSTKRKSLTTATSNEGLAAPSPQLARKAVAALPNDGPFDDYDDWLKVGIAIWGAFGGSDEGKKSWLDFSARWHKPATPGRAEKLWSSVKSARRGWWHLKKTLQDHNPAALRDIKAEEAQAGFSGTAGGAGALRSARTGKLSINDIITLLEISGVEFFLAPGDRQFMSWAGRNVQIGDTPACRELIGRALAKAGHNQPLGKQRRAELLDHLETLALGGPDYPVHVRVAHHLDTGHLYLDLAQKDGGSVIRIEPGQWTVVSPATVPVRFERPRPTCLLPVPAHDQGIGNFLDRLAAHINLPPVRVSQSADDWGTQARAAVIMALSGWLNPAGAKPILMIHAEQGAGKTVAAKRLKQLLDETSVLSCQLGDDEQYLHVAASQAIVVVDNASKLTEAQSNLLCRVATGDGIAKRAHYTNGDIYTRSAKCGQIITTIDDELFRRSDLRSRTLVLPLGDPSVARKPEVELDKSWGNERAAILALFLDAIAEGLKRLPSVQAQSPALPRLTDAGLLAEAVAQELGWPSGLLLEAIDRGQADARASVLSNDPLVSVIVELVDRAPNGEWTGRATDILTAWDQILPHISRPGRANWISRELNKLAPDLRVAHGIEVEKFRTNSNGDRMIRLRLTRP